ncbi:hypothetical protein [Bacillus thuringiensis]|uniref:Uncharacterized protein n=1 Tax=Bacillus thuringiensis TaxID=1428 RepID=A0A9X6WGQ5_BACTU|nr:hypothetical protein [Bacillus thuringiensis]PFJ29046.1 hypothetical protein COJ15_32805 [Bacillus thuringiensis]
MKDAIHDCYVSVTGAVPTKEQIKMIETLLPTRVKHLADEWGCNDTEVRDAIYVLIENNLEKIQYTNN